MKSRKIIKDILIFLFLLILIAAIILPRELNNMDEVWIYNFARNVAEGRLPYKDFNIIQTPLLPLICGAILMIFGNELIVMRILACLLCAFILFITYKIMKKLKINKILSLAAISFLYYMFIPYFTIDYNFANILLILIIVYLELKCLDKNTLKTNLLIGILAGTTILFKQTTGIIVSLICIFYKLLQTDLKENYKEILKQIAIRFFGVLIPVLIGLLYLLLTNSLSDFVSYAILGISSFMDNFIPYSYLLKQDDMIIKILALIIPIFFIIMYYITVVKKQETDFQKNLFILFSYGIAEFSLIFPISISGYLIMGMIVSFISIMYFTDYIFKKVKIKIKIRLFIKYFLLCFIILLIIYFIITTVYTNLRDYFLTVKTYDKIKHFKYIPLNEEAINEIVDFIETSEQNGKTVYILDYQAALFMIPADKYTKDFDMFLIGNLGKDGEDGQIEKIENMSNNEIILIINDNYSINWQNPEKVREYIINNLNKIGEIGIYDIYVKE